MRRLITIKAAALTSVAIASALIAATLMFSPPDDLKGFWVDGALVGVEQRGPYAYYRFFDSVCEFKSREKLGWWASAPVALRGKRVRFAQKGNLLYFVDDNGRRHKTELLMQAFMIVLPASPRDARTLPK